MTDLQALLQQKNEKIELLRALGTRQGFFTYYFDQLPKHRTQVECFNHVNDLHFDLFGEYRYESYNSFRWSVSHYHKNKR